MLKNYFKIAIRNLLRRKAFSFINVAGLATGMACSILILLWVQHELSYDRFHEHADSIYRVKIEIDGRELAVSNPALAAALQAEMPEVRNTVRLKQTYGKKLFEVGQRKFEEDRVFFADSSFLQVFSFQLRHGNSTTALTQPDGLVLTQQMALKYFGEADAIGKTIRLDNQTSFQVVGVLQDVPANSHLQFDFLLPMSFLARTDNDLISKTWNNNNFYTYLQLEKNVDSSPASLAALEERINEIFKNNSPGSNAIFQLQPVTKIHLHSQLLREAGVNGNILYVRIFSIAAVFILLVACINFMNLATARSARRAKEVGLRKVIGARRRQLIGQFMGESLLLTFVALLLALLLVKAALPVFNNLAGKDLAIPITNGSFLLGLLLIAMVTGLVSGAYPALFLSAFQPIKVLKGGVMRFGSGSALFRNGLVVVQFVVSIVLMVGTAVVYKQLSFIQNKNLGYDKENLLYLPLKGEVSQNVNAFRAELEHHHTTSHYSFVSSMPTNVTSGTTGVEWEGKDPTSQPRFIQMAVDENFTDVFNIPLLAGRFFSKEFKADTANYVLNQKALEELGYDAAEAIGKPFTLWGRRGTIVGVVKDFNFQPVQMPVDPLILHLNRGWGVLVVRSQPGQLKAAIADLGQIWQQLSPGFPFTYDFLDQDLAKLYQAEQRMGTIFNAFALLALFISCLGLYGLAAFTAEQRTKEIGVRKVLGASLASILGLLSKDFVRLVLVAIAIAVPVAWYGMSRWLEDYAYRIDLEWWVFALAAGLALLIALFTVSFQAFKTAVANPVKSLRTE